ncbi:MAG: homoserine dehydrogenase [Eubacteriales bacterium]|nr:homoserine dehydrogenase [Eubacteriales bacterium]
MKKVAVLGYGTVGSGVVEVMEQNARFIEQNVGETLEVKYIVDVRDFPDSPHADKMTKDFSIVENDPEVEIVVETIGGAGIAYEFTKRSLQAGKSVITSNKELVAKHGLELLGLAKEKNLNYLFEASVGGGIPIIRPITQCLAANRIDEVYGILNGTTNYILTEMIQNGRSFEDALKNAQALGYAEQNPAADIEGTDACRKISILSDLCYGEEVDPNEVETEGITGVTLDDVKCAASLGYRIKLLGRSVRREEGGISVYVAPHLLPETLLLSRVDGVMNGIVVRGNALGESMFYGAGAGKLPTASAVVADVMDAARHSKRRRDIGWEAASEGHLKDASELESRWYIRAALTPEEAEARYGNVVFAKAVDEEGRIAFLTEKKSGKEIFACGEAESRYRVIEG